MEIKIYAPVDCEVKLLEKCSDPTFANKMLGEGILIIPSKNKFCLPFDEAEANLVFDTKHAYGFKIKDQNVLIHCGIDTVNLAGKPFSTSLEVGKTINKVMKYLM